MHSIEASVLYAKIINLAAAAGARDINTLPGCWTYHLGAAWTIMLNGHAEPIKVGYIAVPPHAAAIDFRGWLAGIVRIDGGVIAGGDEANEAALMSAIDAEIQRIGMTS